MGKNRLNDLNGKNWIKNTISWFHVEYGSRPKEKTHHPATFPYQLAEKFINFFTKEDEWVLEPFLGSGSTLIACRNLKRNGVGIEITKHFAKYAKHRLASDSLVDSGTQKIIRANSSHIDKILPKVFGDNVPKFNFIFSSPPYWNMIKKSRGGSDSRHKDRKEKGLRETYSDMDGDLGNCESYEEFMNKLESIFVKMKPFLDDNAHIALVLQNFRDEDGVFVPFAWDVAYRFRKHFDLLQEQIWCQKDKKAGIWGFPSTYVSNTHHQYIIIFKNKKPI